MNFVQLSIVNIFGFTKENLSLFWKFNIYRLNLRILKHLSDLNRNVHKDPEMSSLDIESLVLLEKQFYNLKETVTEYAQRLLEFLEVISSQNPDLPRIEKFNTKLSALRIEAKQIYKNYLDTNPRSMIYYSNFLRLFLYKSKQAGSIKKMIEIYEDKIKTYKQEDRLFYELNLMYTEKSTIIQLGAGMDNLGKIIKVNVGASHLTKYSISELLSSNVNRLMMHTIAVHHQGYLQRAYKKGVFTIMYREQRNFIVDKIGFCTPISLLVKPMYDIHKNMFQYISYIQPLHSNSAFILVDSEGVIESFSESIGKLLDLAPRNIAGSKTYIQSIMPMFIDFFIEKRTLNTGGLQTIDSFMENCSALKGYPLNLHGDFRGRLFCYRNNSVLAEFDPYISDNIDGDTTMRNSPKRRKQIINRGLSIDEMDMPMKREFDTKLNAMLIQAVSTVKQEYYEWRHNYGLYEGCVYNIDINVRHIKTTSTYVFAFQLKNHQELCKEIDDSIDFVWKQPVKKLDSSATFRLEPKRSSHSNIDLEKIDMGGGEVLSAGQTDKDKKLIMILADIFNQQAYFEDNTKKTKMFEVDDSDTLESSNSFGDDDMQHTSENTSSHQGNSLRSQSNYSAGDSFKQGTEEEILSNIPEMNYSPECYKGLRLLFSLVIGLVTIATLVVLVYDALFNKNLTTLIEQHFSLVFFDGVVARSHSVTLLIFKNKTDIYDTNSLIGKLQKDSADLGPINTKLSPSTWTHEANSEEFVEATNRNIKVKVAGNLDEYFEVNTFEYYRMHSNWLDKISNETTTSATAESSEALFGIFYNSAELLNKIKTRLTRTWYPSLSTYYTTLMIILLGSIIVTAGFSVWIFIQTERCYDYINMVYGLMVSFSPVTIRTHKLLINDLAHLMETKVN